MVDFRITLTLCFTMSNVCISQETCPAGDLSAFDLTPSDITHDHGRGTHTHTDAQLSGWSHNGVCFLHHYTDAYLREHDYGSLHDDVDDEDDNNQPPSVIDDLEQWLKDTSDTSGPQTARSIREYIESHPDYVPPSEQGIESEQGVDPLPEIVDAEVGPVAPEIVDAEVGTGSVNRLTPEEIERLPEEVQTLVESLPDSAKLVIDVVPTAETLGSEHGQILHLHTGPLSDLPGMTGTHLERPTLGDPESDVFLENVQFLVFSHPIVTEYMLRGWSKGQGNLPQWIELYNPDDAPVNLKGWRIKYVEKGNIKTLRLKNFHIPAGGVGILASHAAMWKSRYIDDDAVYILDIPKRSLEQGWLLLDAEGIEVHRIGVAFRTDALSELSDPVKPDLVNRGRVSHNRYASELPPRGGYFYGHSQDVGTPGFFELPAPASPSKARPKLQTSWGAIKKERLK